MFALLLALLYLPVWLLFTTATPLLTRTLSVVLSQAYSVAGYRLEADDGADQITFRLFTRPGLEGEISTKAVVSNTVFLLALLAATPGLNWKNRLIRVLLGLILLLFSQVFFLATKVEIALLAADHPVAGSRWFWQAADNFFEITGKVFFPIFIWLALTLPYMTGRALDSRQPVPHAPVKVGRNTPCPCGSGKKYKLCCGK